MDRISIIRNVDFFSELNEVEIDEVANLFELAEFNKGDIIFEEGTIGDCFYILIEGEVEIIKKLDEDGSTEAELRLFSPPEYFGEMSLVDESPRSATAKAHANIKTLRLMKENFMKICLEHPRVIFHLIKTISNRLRATNQRFVEIVDTLLKKNKMAAIGTAAAKIVHDIKTPITVIILTAQLIERVFPNTNDFTEKIVKQAKALDEMIREILDFARGEQSQLNLQENDIQAMLEDINETTEPMANDKKITIQIENSLTEMVVFDSAKIKRTIINLVKNAIEAIPEGGLIRIVSLKEDRQWKLSVIDNGSGIPEDILDKIFEPFVTKGKKGGTGLGLAICQKLVQDHHGSLVVYNPPEGGARFDLIMPIQAL